MKFLDVNFYIEGQLAFNIDFAMRKCPAITTLMVTITLQ